MARTVKVAIIGSGLAGLTAAYLLSKTRTTEDVVLEVHLFEKASTLGMDSSSVSLPNPGGDGEWRVDVPMRSFQGGYYPQLISLYTRLGVAFREADFSYSFSLLSPSTKARDTKITTTMIYNGASGRAGISMPSCMLDIPKGKGSLNTLLESLAASAYAWGLFLLFTLRLLLNYIWLQVLALPFVRPERVDEMTFREWSEEHAIPRGTLARWTGFDASWRAFVSEVLVPLFSAVCTAPEEDIWEHPVEEFLDYIWLTLGTHHYVVKNGVKDVVARLTAFIPQLHIHLASPISGVHPDPISPHLVSIECACTTSKNTNRTHIGFAHVIFATQATHAVPLLASYQSELAPGPHSHAVGELSRCLEAFQYRSTVVVTHTDDGLMPDCTSDRRDLNLIRADNERGCGCSTGKGENEAESAYVLPPSYTMATHVLSPPLTYPLEARRVLQTTNPIIPPAQDHILSVTRLERAVLTLDAKRALKELYRPERSGGRWTGALGPLQGTGRLVNGRREKEEGAGPGIWVCGSYAAPGIPLLEGCVVSARNVVERGVLMSEGVRIRGSPW